MNTDYFYHDKPIFGLDIGFSTLKVLQTESSGKKLRVTGYGSHSFDSNAVQDGVIVDVESIAKSAKELFESHIIGDISTRRVALSIPAARTFTRTMTLPIMKPKEQAEAVRLEAEQYIPIPVDNLYIDYEVVRQTEEEQELLVVAAPKKMIDSYLDFVHILGLEPVVFEPSTIATSRLFADTENSDAPSILIDFGSMSADLTVVEKTVLVTGTVQGGGDNFTNLIAQRLGVTKQEAAVIKVKYGLGVSKKQSEIMEVMEPGLKDLVKEIRRVIRYYDDRSGSDKKISQIVTMGGGANMPGLSTYLTDVLRMPVRMCDPWEHLDFGNLQPPNTSERSMYITVAGLALVKPKEAFA